MSAERAPLKFIVIHSHRSEYPRPITLLKGDELEVGEEYCGSECWENWYFCTANGQQGGWVPAQVFKRLEGDKGRVLEDYTAKELDVDPGDTVLGFRQLNGWVWCSRQSGLDSGWVPLESLREVSQ